MKFFRFKKLLTDNGWQDDVSLEIDGEGLIRAMAGRPVGPGPNTEVVNGFAVPGFQNAHSHAFQYAMAGVAEIHSNAANDDFWAWRETMYQIALSISPDDVETIATMLYSEMARHGYTHVAEFHYLHHDKNGGKYNNPAELGGRLVAAAEKSGIKITLVPVFYQRGGFGQPPHERQRRFVSKTIEEYVTLLEASKSVVAQSENAALGYGIHSLRAVTPEDVITVRGYDDTLPFHVHISEQKQEVADAEAYFGKRPVQWLLDNIAVGHNCHLVHATHLSQGELEGIANAQANVVLCPTTEGNLADGLFPLINYQRSNGRWCIGTDSHISLSPLEELRMLDYGQRAKTNKRSTFINEQQKDSGANAYRQSLINGRAAMGNTNEAYFKIGGPLDAMVYDASHPLLAASSNNTLLSTIIYSADAAFNLGTLVNGRWVNKHNQYFNQEKVRADFLNTLNRLNFR